MQAKANTWSRMPLIMYSACHSFCLAMQLRAWSAYSQPRPMMSKDCELPQPSPSALREYPVSDSRAAWRGRYVERIARSSPSTRAAAGGSTTATRTESIAQARRKAERCGCDRSSATDLLFGQHGRRTEIGGSQPAASLRGEERSRHLFG